MKEIREMTGQENGQISPYLKMMTDQKIVERMAKKQRGAKYRIIDLLIIGIDQILSWRVYKVTIK